MKFHINVVCMNDDGTEQPKELMVLSRDELVMETMGLTLAESKALLHDLQSYVVEHQAVAYLERHRACPRCNHRYTSKGQGTRIVNTIFGPTSVPNPRWFCCTCSPTNGALTFRPTGHWLTGRTSPELLYIETKWASLIPFAKVVGLLKDVLPVAQSLNPETVRSHLYSTANRIEQELGEEREHLFEGSEDDWAAQPTPDGPMTVGIDGGMVRARHKGGFFEVIAGKSIVAFKRKEEKDIPSTKRFAFVQTHDKKPRRRLWELMKSQGLQENQHVVFMSDGGDTVRNLQRYLHPSSEHVLDWFHVTMRLTVMRQQNKAILEEDEPIGTETATRWRASNTIYGMATSTPRWSGWKVYRSILSVGVTRRPQRRSCIAACSNSTTTFATIVSSSLTLVSDIDRATRSTLRS